MRGRVRPLLRLLVGAAVVVALVWRFGAGPVLDGLRAVDLGSVLAALVIGLVSTVCGAWRWCLVARGLGMRLSLPAAVADCYQALFLNSVLPAGVLGDVHRAVGHGRQEGDVGRGPVGLRSKPRSQNSDRQNRDHKIAMHKTATA